MFKSSLRGLMPCLLLVLAGCMRPPMGPAYMYGPGSYQQPGYQPPGYQQPGYGVPGSYGAPGTLVVPPSNAPLYESGSGAGSTYESDPRDTWTSPGAGGAGGTGGADGSGGDMFDEGGLVPKPKEPGAGDSGSPFYEDNFNKSGVQLIPPTGANDAARLASQSSTTGADPLLVSRPVSYGFDTNGYRWLQGVLKQQPQSGEFSVTYNPGGDDTFQGNMLLIVESDRLQGLQDGSVVQVRGHVDSEHLDTRGRAMYRVEQIYEVPLTQ